MSIPRVFTVKIETTLLAYCDEDLLYEFIETVRSGSFIPEVSIPIIDKSLIQIDENGTDIHPINFGEEWCHLFAQDHSFNNGRICKLKKDGSSSEPAFTLKLVSEEEAELDARKFDFNNYIFFRGGRESESRKWIYEVVWQRKNLLRFGKALNRPSSFPKIEEFDSHSLHRRCSTVAHLYGKWVDRSDGKTIEEEDQNRLNYFLLRYPELERIFENMKNSGIQSV
jgi:hypothetical protein